MSLVARRIEFDTDGAAANLRGFSGVEFAHGLSQIQADTHNKQIHRKITRRRRN